jgi:hypothetical protein
VPATAPPAPAEVKESEDVTFSKEQLEQIVAPIALYPDALLTQMLMAATYPLEIVQADRFMRANPGLKDTALEEKLKEQDWDTSVKGLCSLPDVLKNMSTNLDWTQDLGDAFLAQQAEVLDTVQRMRGKANDAGNLKTSEQQVVTVQQDKIIVIESKSPEVIYVPTYSPTVVYGAGWGYPMVLPVLVPPGALRLRAGHLRCRHRRGCGDLGRLPLGLGSRQHQRQHQPVQQLQRPEPGQSQPRWKHRQ